MVSDERHTHIRLSLKRIEMNIVHETKIAVGSEGVMWQNTGIILTYLFTSTPSSTLFEAEASAWANLLVSNVFIVPSIRPIISFRFL